MVFSDEYIVYDGFHKLFVPFLCLALESFQILVLFLRAFVFFFKDGNFAARCSVLFADEDVSFSPFKMPFSIPQTLLFIILTLKYNQSRNSYSSVSSFSFFLIHLYFKIVISIQISLITLLLFKRIASKAALTVFSE